MQYDISKTAALDILERLESAVFNPWQHSPQKVHEKSCAETRARQSQSDLTIFQKGEIIKSRDKLIDTRADAGLSVLIGANTRSKHDGSLGRDAD